MTIGDDGARWRGIFALPVGESRADAEFPPVRMGDGEGAQPPLVFAFSGVVGDHHGVGVVVGLDFNQVVGAVFCGIFPAEHQSFAAVFHNFGELSGEFAFGVDGKVGDEVQKFGASANQFGDFFGAAGERFGGLGEVEDDEADLPPSVVGIFSADGAGDGFKFSASAPEFAVHGLGGEVFGEPRGGGERVAISGDELFSVPSGADAVHFFADEELAEVVGGGVGDDFGESPGGAGETGLRAPSGQSEQGEGF